MAPRITLVCHATTRELRAATFGGDASLDEAGRATAQRLNGALGRVDRCWTSPALRARETATALGLDPAVDERLRDCDFGRWSGLRFQQVLLKEPRKLVRWMKDPAAAPHGGEAIPDVMARATAWLSERERDKGHTVAITHAAVVRALIVHVIRAELRSFWRIDVTPLSFTDLRTNGRRWVLRSISPGAPAEDSNEGGRGF
jgi:broad specificity phosphatase PhoE